MPDPDSPLPLSAAKTNKFSHPIKRHLKRSRRLLIGTAVILLLQSLVIVALPWPVKFLIDDVLSIPSLDRPLFSVSGAITAGEAIGLTALALFVLATLNALLELWQEKAVERTAQNLIESIREDLLSALLTRRLSFIDSRRRLDLLARISGDTGRLESLLSPALRSLFRGLPVLIMALALAASVDIRFSLILASALPLMFALVRHFARRSRAETKDLRREHSFYDQDLDHTISALPTIKSLNIEPIALRSLTARSERMASLSIQAEGTKGRLGASLHWVKNILRAAAVLIGGTAVLRGNLSVGSLTLLIAYVDAISRPIQDLAELVAHHSRLLPGLERLEDLFDELADGREKEGSLNISSLPFPNATDLRFENISFGYDGGPVLIDDFSEEFHAGEMVAVIGASGVGKSTFARLMNRLLDPVQGRILFGRNDIRRFRLQLLRDTICLIPPEPYFIEGTVRENLLLGLAPDEAPPDDAEISSALHSAAASDFVAGLTHRLDTVIGGPHADRLSPAQAKRLHLARAFLRSKARVVIFDHPTTGLDAESAATILESARELADAGVLVFWITHRLEDALECDRVVYFNDRRPRSGEHEKLMEGDPSYKALFAKTRRTSSRKITRSRLEV